MFIQKNCFIFTLLKETKNLILKTMRKLIINQRLETESPYVEDKNNELLEKVCAHLIETASENQDFDVIGEQVVEYDSEQVGTIYWSIVDVEMDGNLVVTLSIASNV